MTHRCLVADDEALARELIVTHLSVLPQFSLVATCASALEVRNFLQRDTVDLLFLDIEMPLLKGTDLIKSLRHPPSVIFTTAYRNYALDGFELDAVDYLLKPISFARFFRATEKYLRQRPATPAGGSTADHVFVRKDRKQVRLLLDEIDYLESLRDYVCIHAGPDRHTVKYPLATLREMLDDRFLQTHRSFVVNADKVTAFTKRDVEIGAREIPIGESYKSEVLCRLSGGIAG